MDKLKNNQGLLLILLSGVGVIILLLAIMLQPAPDAALDADRPDFYQFTAASIPEGTTLFEVDTAVSTATFTIDELLRGEPKTVVGTTDEVAGQLVLDFDNPQAAQFSDFALLAQTLRTDNSLRDSALRDRILFTNEHPLISFTPTQIFGLPEAVTVGNSIQFSIEGELTISGETNVVTFQAEALTISPTQIELHATTTISRTPFDITIPNVPGVANVSEEIGLELDLVFTAVQE